MVAKTAAQSTLRFHSGSETELGGKEWKKTWCCTCSWCSLCAPLVLGSEWQKKLAGFMSAKPLLILQSIPSRVCCLHCSRLYHFRLPSMDVTLPDDLYVLLLVTHLTAHCCTFLSFFIFYCCYEYVVDSSLVTVSVACFHNLKELLTFHLLLLLYSVQHFEDFVTQLLSVYAGLFCCFHTPPTLTWTQDLNNNMHIIIM